MSESNTAVLDRTDAQADTTALGADDAKTLTEGTDGGVRDQTAIDAGADKDTADKANESDEDAASDEDDHEAQLERERIEARAEEIAAKKIADKEEADREKREADAETARKQRAREARKTALDAAAALAEPSKLNPQDGRLLAYVNPATGDFEAVPAKSITDVIEKLNLDVEAAADQNVQTRWTNGIDRSLPTEEVRKDFWDWMGTENKPIHEVIDKLTELRAPQSAWAKALTLDDAVAASTAVKKAVADLKDTEFKAGREKGRTDRGRSAGARERGDGGGVTTYTEYMKLPEKEKAAFNKEHPDQFKAFLGIGPKGND